MYPQTLREVLKALMPVWHSPHLVSELFLRAERAAWAAVTPLHLVGHLRTSCTRLWKMRPQNPSLEPQLGVPWLQEEQHQLPLCRLLVSSHKLCSGSWQALGTLQGYLAETLKQWLHNCSHFHVLAYFSYIYSLLLMKSLKSPDLYSNYVRGGYCNCIAEVVIVLGIKNINKV